MTDTLLAMEKIQKQFGKVSALNDASFQLKKGEIHALLGANGAGKSTLMKILSGVYEHDGGEILLDGKELRFKSPKAAKEQGVYCVYQEVDTALVPELSVAENIMLDTFASQKALFISKKKINERAKEALKQLQSEHISVQKQALELTLAEKQIVLIARALVHSAKIIIFDEPTAPLSFQESGRLFSVMKKLKSQSVGCIFISHRLPEVFEICDRVTVMREGKTVSTSETALTTQDQVVEDMLGSAFTSELGKQEKHIGSTLLEVSELTDGHKLHDISFSVSEGEIVGVVGLVGAGKTELAKTLFGVTPAKQGKISLNKKEEKIHHPSDAIKAGIALVPEERRKEGLFVHESLRINSTFPNLRKFTRGFFMHKPSETAFADQIIASLQIKTNNTETPLVNLSGGNQQKVAIGKWTSLDSSIYLFDEPTKGVDIGAKVDIFKLIRQISEKQKGVIYFSSEIHEILGISDRILVMYDGKIVKEFSRNEATQEKILLYASGGKEEQHEREQHSVSI
ncbi:sugar ABC transporter ATP-binding protein [Bacillus sp. DTU_2020_1000418_1_SI_GHA_SEK_038]|uniref:sugar ABC transporter ATP-binding protein n=1 Tax=Bacillus sp. DTU_2020_1000418_1_SI_GHA_SEK_038 TaxID=3077585 RepID=UPI0028E52703|nr:sugar ABC transporter ATP-binding protein [Bacillus sp. DTU_2020_1000418_1_SI_GHA_SEK_038]WNS75825.1 sugar ABC transporter ATP-binding protein [Bacillus sp. DTU_2020_1000418_1_SI_GHA_SEK_038]